MSIALSKEQSSVPKINLRDRVDLEFQLEFDTEFKVVLFFWQVF